MGKIQSRMRRQDKIFPIFSVLWKVKEEEPLGRKCMFLGGNSDGRAMRPRNESRLNV